MARLAAIRTLAGCEWWLLKRLTAHTRLRHLFCDEEFLMPDEGYKVTLI
jgi:hypothetical protein